MPVGGFESAHPVHYQTQLLGQDKVGIKETPFAQPLNGYSKEGGEGGHDSVGP